MATITKAQLASTIRVTAKILSRDLQKAQQLSKDVSTSRTLRERYEGQADATLVALIVINAGLRAAMEGKGQQPLAPSSEPDWLDRLVAFVEVL